MTGSERWVLLLAMELALLLIGIALAIFAVSFLILSMIRLGRESERIANEIKNEENK